VSCLIKEDEAGSGFVIFPYFYVWLNLELIVIFLCVVELFVVQHYVCIF